jgi:predicted nucleotidyltransferase
MGQTVAERDKKNVMRKELEEAIKSDSLIEKSWQTAGLAGYRGSVAHGTCRDIIDDIDIIGVFVAPLSHYLGLTCFERVERIGVKNRYDFCLYEIKKYVGLLLKSNPNVLGLLWLPQNLYIKQSSWGKLLIDNRNIFLSKTIYKTFGGYAYAQLSKMTRPATKQAFQGEKRRERFEKYGYDCKNAAHLIRLLRMGIEALSASQINVVRYDARELKDIKQGKWELEKVRGEAHRLQNLLDEAYVRSSLPAKPDFHKAEKLLIDILVKQKALFKERS